MDTACPKCNEEVSDADSGLLCTGCEYTYHVSPCSGVTDATFRSKGSAIRKSWRCQTCKTVKSRGGSLNSKEEIEPGMAAMFATINAKLDSLLDLKETVGGIEHFMQELSDKYDEVVKDISEQKKETKKLQKRVETLEKSDADGEIKRLRLEVNDLEWRSRKLNLEIHGIPQADKEDLLAKVNEVAKKLDVPDLALNEVSAVHRLASRSDKVPGVIVRLTNQTTRDHWLRKRLTLRTSEDEIYIQENLTKHGRALLWEAKEWAKTANYRYVWYKNGNVLLRKKERERVHVIKSSDDLQKLV